MAEFKAPKPVFLHFIISDLPCMILSLALFLGGIWLISLRIPWGSFFGIIFTPLGVSLIIFILDDVARNVVIPPPFEPTRCNVCGKITYAEKGKEDVICGRCWKEMAEKVLKEKAK